MDSSLDNQYSLPEADVSDTYYYRNRAEVKGPYSRSQMQSLVRRHRVGRHNEISSDGHQWARGSEFPELFEATVARKVRKKPQAPVVTETEPEPARSSHDTAIDSGDTFTLERPADGVALPDNWHFMLGEQQQGPVSLEELVNLISSGQILSEDYVWAESMENWLPVGQIPELATCLPNLDMAEAEDVFVNEDIVATGGVLQTQSGTSALAVSSLILGILGASILWGVAAIPAVVLGHVALAEVNRTGLQGRGFAVTGIVLGYSALGITLLGLLMVMVRG